LVVNHPDSIKKEIDYIISLVKDNEDAYRYTLSSILNKYAKNKFIGMDAIYVHMIDTYYSQGTADWVDEENLLKMQENANNLRPILIGKVFPNITVYKEDLTPVRINNVKSDYTMVIFWAPDCGHCKKSMPKIVDFYEKYKDKGLKVVSVCTKGGEKLANCWEYIEEKGMEGFINTGDKYQKYRRYVYVPSTPKIFLLDDNKEILIKDMPADELPNIMDKILEEKAAE
jgi:thiol-disulfide isomerase/thioredoxin